MFFELAIRLCLHCWNLSGQGLPTVSYLADRYASVPMSPCTKTHLCRCRDAQRRLCADVTMHGAACIHAVGQPVCTASALSQLTLGCAGAADYVDTKIRELITCVVQLQQGLEGATFGGYDADVETLASVTRVAANVARQVL